MKCSDTTGTATTATNSTDSSSSSRPTPTVVASPCAACKILRRRCADTCVLAPYFPPTEPLKFTTAHRVFGASNIIKFLQSKRCHQAISDGIHCLKRQEQARSFSFLMEQKQELEESTTPTPKLDYCFHKKSQELPESQRADAVSSMVYEANARIRDPVYGCAGAICQLQKQVNELQAQLAKAQAELLNMQCQQANLVAFICMEMGPSPQLLDDSQMGSPHSSDDYPYFMDDNNNLCSPWEEALWT